jgi:hypothetical protein
METVPGAMHLMYAIGSSTDVGYHKTRECFEITEFPSCPTNSEEVTVEKTSEASKSSETSTIEVVSSAARARTLLP